MSRPIQPETRNGYVSEVVASMPSESRRSNILLLLLLLFAWLLAVTAIGRGITVSRGDRLPPHVAVAVNPNSAPWWELTILPDVGPTLARRIVAHRTAIKLQDGSTDPPFRGPTDLNAVPGIGQKTVRRIAPYLCFDEPQGSSQSEPAK